MKIGDRVKVLHESIEGKVSRVEGTTYWVNDGDFEFPFEARDLVLIEDNEDQIRKEYARHSIRGSIKPDDLPKQPEMTKEERVEELGRVRGKRNSKGILEFDLHIHDLLVSHQNMTPGEMLNYQLDYAVHCLEEVIRKRENALIFIHGVGKGVLKSELHKIIKAYNFPYHDGFMQEYGVGATRVELRGI